MSTTYAHVFEAHRAAVRDLKHAPSQALAIPTAADVRAQLHRLNLDLSTDDTFVMCRELGLHLADMPAESDEPTRKLTPL